MDYPIEYVQCPMCHCKERVIEHEVNEQVKKGKLAEGRIPTSSVKMLPIVDPIAGPGLSAPVLTVYQDICRKCGYEYNHIITRQEMPGHVIEAILGIKGPKHN